MIRIVELFDGGWVAMDDCGNHRVTIGETRQEAIDGMDDATYQEWIEQTRESYKPYAESEFSPYA